MNLSDMSFDDLEKLQKDLGYLHKAALPLKELAEEGGAIDDLRFDLTPGCEAKIHTGWQMPIARRVVDLGPCIVETFVSPRDYPYREGPENLGGSGDLQRVCHAESPPAEPAASTPETGESPEPAAQPGDVETEVVSGAGPSVSADIAPGDDFRPEDVDPASLAMPSAPLVPGGWTADDERRLIDGVALRVARGETVRSALQEVAVEIDRSAASCNNRLYGKLREQYAEALDAAVAALKPSEPIKPQADLIRDSIARHQGQPDPKQVATTPAKPAVRDRIEIPISSAPKAAQNVPDTGRVEEQPAPKAGGAGAVFSPSMPVRQREIVEQLALAPRRKGYDAELDLEIVEGLSKGIKAAQLALDLGVDSKEMLDRFREVSACIRNDRGQMNFTDQGHLIAVLRHKVKGARTSAT